MIVARYSPRDCGKEGGCARDAVAAARAKVVAADRV
jgi:hypothetical protein